MAKSDIPYAKWLQLARASGEPISSFLRSELPGYWCDIYQEMFPRPNEVVLFTYGTFDYWFDSYQMPEQYDPASGVLPTEARLVAAIGNSKPKRSRRDDYRLRGLVLSSMSGSAGPWDRGHFIGHAIGGTVDGNEANVFLQLRATNRGRYRAMEHYCRNHPDTLCFSRPIYVDPSAHPSAVEFGVLKQDGELWVDVLPNR